MQRSHWLREPERQRRRFGAGGSRGSREFSFVRCIGLEHELANALLRCAVADRRQQCKTAPLAAHGVLARGERFHESSRTCPEPTQVADRSRRAQRLNCVVEFSDNHMAPDERKPLLRPGDQVLGEVCSASKRLDHSFCREHVLVR